MRQGPDEKLVSEVDRNAGGRFDQRQELLKRRNPGLSEGDLELARKLTRDALAGIAGDQKSPLRGSAQEALKRLQAPRRPGQ